MRIVAELGTNTNGSLERALRMVEAAAEAGVDGIKVQAYEVMDFLPAGHPDWDMFTAARLSFDEIRKVQELCLDLGLEFGATPTSTRGVAWLKEMGVDWLKNGSDFLLRHDLIQAMLDTGIETWVATGMATAQEVWDLPGGARLMACTSAYPCPDEEAHLYRLTNPGIDGYSDHTTGTTAGVLAVAFDALMFEFHCTLSHDLPGPDHAFSRDPAEMAALVREVRRAEAMIGSHELAPTPSEEANRDKWRVREGEVRK